MSVAPPFQAATTWRRALARLVDTAAVAALWAPLAWLTRPDPATLPDVPWNLLDRLVDTFNAQPAVFLVPAAVLLAMALLWDLGWQLRGSDTPGKRLLGLTVVTPSGERPPPGRTVVHAALRALSYVLLMPAHLWALADRERRTLYDRAARLWVVRR
jgi:uncharacterized RDD family membrane protein YckC